MLYLMLKYAFLVYFAIFTCVAFIAIIFSFFFLVLSFYLTAERSVPEVTWGVEGATERWPS